MKRLALLVPVAAALLSVGCLESSSVITVKKDGSGTIVQRSYMSAKMAQSLQQMARMAAQMAGASGAEVKVPENPLLDEQQFRANAVRWGAGVRYVSAKPLARGDGSKGAEVLYTFRDIRQLKFDPEPERPGPGGAPGMPPGAPGVPPPPPPPGAPSGADAAGGARPSPITFGFTPGASPTLTIRMPAPKAAAAPKMSPAQEAQFKQKAQMQAAMMKQMMEGLRLDFRVQVEGEIRKTNASHVEVLEATGKKQVVTLFDMDFSQLLKDEAAFQSLIKPDAAHGGLAAAMGELKGQPGMTIEPARVVTVTFK